MFKVNNTINLTDLILRTIPALLSSQHCPPCCIHPTKTPSFYAHNISKERNDSFNSDKSYLALGTALWCVCVYVCVCVSVCLCVRVQRGEPIN